MINKEKLSDILNKNKDDVEYAISISDKFVLEHTSALDDLMKDINLNIIAADNVSNVIIEKYFLELTNALYFINSKCELFGFYDAISKSNAQLAYNKAFGDAQLNAATSGKKITVAETQIAAENESFDDNVANYIYSRSYKIIKTKIDNAAEMIKTLSKILSSHIADNDLEKLGSAIRNNFTN